MSARKIKPGDGWAAASFLCLGFALMLGIATQLEGSTVSQLRSGGVTADAILSEKYFLESLGNPGRPRKTNHRLFFREPPGLTEEQSAVWTRLSAVKDYPNKIRHFTAWEDRAWIDTDATTFEAARPGQTFQIVFDEQDCRFSDAPYPWFGWAVVAAFLGGAALCLAKTRAAKRRVAHDAMP